ncbi:MAG: hypothetical protein HKK67_10510 [Chlorobiaceae bacterium]|nr:hypothetical protein [Chlorobiaceae bacterium]
MINSLPMRRSSATALHDCTAKRHFKHAKRSRSDTKCAGLCGQPKRHEAVVHRRGLCLNTLDLLPTAIPSALHHTLQQQVEWVKVL